MPFAAKTRCRTHGCPNLVASGYCDTCKAAGAIKEVRKTAAQRGYGSRWQKTSKAFLAAHPLCADPYGAHGRVLIAADCTDHIVPHKGSWFLFWDPTNWQGLCNGCHSRKTALEDGGFGHARG